MAVGADPPDGARLEHPQQLGLERERQVADLIEEDGTAVRLLERAGALAERAAERAALVAEELALEERLRDRRAVHGHERPPAARALLVEPARGAFLAGSGLAEEQHGRVGLGGPLEQPEGAAHRHRLADQGSEASGGRQLDLVGVRAAEPGAERHPEHRGAERDQRAVERGGVADADAVDRHAAAAEIDDAQAPLLVVNRAVQHLERRVGDGELDVGRAPDPPDGGVPPGGAHEQLPARRSGDHLDDELTRAHRRPPCEGRAQVSRVHPRPWRAHPSRRAQRCCHPHNGR
jgi:hypothetical protein